jgi:hypothetical protein
MRKHSRSSWLTPSIVFERRQTILLGAIAAAFVVRPLLGNLKFATEIFSIALMALMIVALYTVRIDELIASELDCWPRENVGV